MEKLYNYNGNTVSYNDIGQGQVVVLLHGFGEDSCIWNNLVENLSKEYRVIIPDLPGSGKSGMLNSDKAEIEDYSTCMMKLLENEKIVKCILLGHSMGGYITLAFAEKYAALLCGFGLIHSTAFADNEDKKENRRKSIQFLKENNSFAFLKTSIPNLFSEKTKKESVGIITSLIKRGESFSSESLIQYCRAMMNRPDRTNVLSTTKLPVMMIIGEEDKAVPMEDVLKQVHLPAIVLVHILTDVGHMGMLEKPLALTEYLLSFCRFVYPNK